MSLTNKGKTIEACEILIQKYKSATLRTKLFSHDVCPLCDIHLYSAGVYAKCHGCPLADLNGEIGCLNFKSSRDLKDLKDLIAFSDSDRETGIEVTDLIKFKEACQVRADFFKKIIPILEEIDEKRFTKEGWTYFEELDRSW